MVVFSNVVTLFLNVWFPFCFVKYLWIFTKFFLVGCGWIGFQSCVVLLPYFDHFSVQNIPSFRKMVLNLQFFSSVIIKWILTVFPKLHSHQQNLIECCYFVSLYSHYRQRSHRSWIYFLREPLLPHFPLILEFQVVLQVKGIFQGWEGASYQK